jgi:hypothetical protein
LQFEPQAAAAAAASCAVGSPAGDGIGISYFHVDSNSGNLEAQPERSYEPHL